MKNKHIFTSFVSIVVIVTLICILIEHLYAGMNHTMYMTFQLTSITGIITLIGLVLFEEKGDERIEAHKKFASRIAYISGLMFASIGLTIQSLNNHIDPWLLAVVLIMVSAKFFGRVYSSLRN